jgi:tRNA(Ile)-lysidine synthase
VADPACAPGALLARCAFPEAGTAVTCAVSGGADSLALLVLATEAGCAVTAVHVDHGARAGSAEEAQVVAAAAARFGASFRGERVVVAPGPNFEARARAARYGVLPAGVLTGHTADDQAETVLLNLLRGAGIDGLAGMRRDGRRPILGLRRSETEALCRSLGLDPVVDPTNDDPSFRRNRVRHEVLPLLDDVAARDIVPLVARLADHAREVSDHLREEAALVDVHDARALSTTPPAVARVAVREWLRSCSDDRHPPDAATVDRVLRVADLASTATDVGGGWRVARTAGQLRLERSDVLRSRTAPAEGDGLGGPAGGAEAPASPP